MVVGGGLADFCRSYCLVVALELERRDQFDDVLCCGVGYVDKYPEGVGSRRVLREYSDEVQVVDKLRGMSCGYWGEGEGALYVQAARGVVEVETLVV